MEQPELPPNESVRYEAPPEVKEWVVNQYHRLYGQSAAPLSLDEWKKENEEFQKRIAENKEYELEYARCQGRAEQVERLEEELIEVRKKKDKETTERAEEVRERAIPKNLLTHYADTVRAMGLLEGEGWVARQERTEGKTVASALQDVRNYSGESQGGVSTIYGSGGLHRYFVAKDGTVTFSEGHALPEATLRAKRLGFPIV